MQSTAYSSDDEVRKQRLSPNDNCINSVCYIMQFMSVLSMTIIRQHNRAVYVGMVVVVCIMQYNGKPKTG